MSLQLQPLPMSVIGGYLGAGKTTLINRVLREDHGLRIMVLVNDFGAINIDAKLLISADEDTIELANGCVCCTMGADLFMAVGKVLDRAPRPDHLIIEASGIADPARIANVARAEPDLSYAGVVTVVDGENGQALLADEQIATQVAEQIACADLIAISKTAPGGAFLSELQRLNDQATLARSHCLPIEAILLAGDTLPNASDEAHLQYAKWSHIGDAACDPETLQAALTDRPTALYRLKGWVRGSNGEGALVQVAGAQIEISTIPQPKQTTLVGIGLATRLSQEDCTAWWHEKTTAALPMRDQSPEHHGATS